MRDAVRSGSRDGCSAVLASCSDGSSERVAALEARNRGTQSTGCARAVPARSFRAGGTRGSIRHACTCVRRSRSSAATRAHSTTARASGPIVTATDGQGVSLRSSCQDGSTQGPGWPEGARVSLVGEGLAECSAWSEVAVNDVRSWVRTQYLAASPPPTAVAPKVAPAPTNRPDGCAASRCAHRGLEAGRASGDTTARRLPAARGGARVQHIRPAAMRALQADILGGEGGRHRRTLLELVLGQITLWCTMP